MKESEIERHLCEQVHQWGGEVRKLKWINRRGAPDRIVMMQGKTIFVELKAPGEKPKPHQIREHKRLHAMGQKVFVIDTKEQVNDLMKEIMQ